MVERKLLRLSSRPRLVLEKKIKRWSRSGSLEYTLCGVYRNLGGCPSFLDDPFGVNANNGPRVCPYANRRKAAEKRRGTESKRNRPGEKESPFVFSSNCETRRWLILTGRLGSLRWPTGSRYRARVLAYSSVFQKRYPLRRNPVPIPIPRCKRRGGPQQDSPVRNAHTLDPFSLHVHACVGYKSLAVPTISPCGGSQRG